MYFPQGARCTYNATFVQQLVSFGPSSAEIIAAVTNDLQVNQGLNIEDSQNVTPPFFSIHENEVVVLKVFNNGTDHNSEQDIRAIIDHSFYIALGQLPDSSSITDVTQPGGQPEATGAPSPTNPGANGSSSIGWLDKLKAGATGGAIGIAVGALAVVVLIVIVVAKAEAP